MSVLRVCDLSKSFGSVPVLHNLSLTLGKGEILGLIGENGAGKSTLMRCICGLLKPDGGSIERAASCYMIPQELTFVGSMTVAENLFLGREETRFGWIQRKKIRDETAAALARIGANSVSPLMPMEKLGVADRQKVAIAKALLEKSDLLILDEPTAVLSKGETRQLFDVLRALQKDGVSMIYISHKLDEVLSLCSRIAVLRDGALVEQGAAFEYTEHRLAEAMVGRPLAEIYPPKRPAPDAGAEPFLRAENLSDGAAVKNASFSLHAGEILGVAGLAGAGRTELAELICGMRSRRAGSLFLRGKAVCFHSMQQALRHGIAYLSEDRQGTGLLMNESIADNAALSALRKYSSGPFLSFRKLLSRAQQRIRELHIRCENAGQPVKSLSGGNQQKVAIAKGLDTDPGVYIFDEPTRGVDIGARSEIYAIMHRLAETGVAILLISSDLGEIIGNCRRSLVMHEGKIVGELADENLTEQRIMVLASGLSQKSPFSNSDLT